DAAVPEEKNPPPVRRPLRRLHATGKLAELRRLAACEGQHPRLRRTRAPREEEQSASVGREAWRAVGLALGELLGAPAAVRHPPEAPAVLALLDRPSDVDDRLTVRRQRRLLDQHLAEHVGGAEGTRRHAPTLAPRASEEQASVRALG